jgi:hypothetical protein
VQEALNNNNWISDLNIHRGLIATHLSEFATLWNLTHDVDLLPHLEDHITWKFSSTGHYSTAPVYKAQLFGSTNSPQISSMWKALAPIKCKFFTWLIIQNRVWSLDRLAHRCWPHNLSYPLCRRTEETTHHLLVECRYTKRIWSLTAAWLA